MVAFILSGATVFFAFCFSAFCSVLCSLAFGLFLYSILLSLLFPSCNFSLFPADCIRLGVWLSDDKWDHGMVARPLSDAYSQSIMTKITPTAQSTVTKTADAAIHTAQNVTTRLLSAPSRMISSDKQYKEHKVETRRGEDEAESARLWKVGCRSFVAFFSGPYFLAVIVRRTSSQKCPCFPLPCLSLSLSLSLCLSLSLSLSVSLDRS